MGAEMARDIGETLPKTVWTIGHSVRPWPEFVTPLRRWGIAVVVDVRRFPVSTRNPHFAKAAMEAELAAEGVRYVHLGASLGGYRTGGYRAYMETEGFRQGIEELERIAGAAPAAVLCAERLPWKCHRRFIAAALEERGWKVVHIVDGGAYAALESGAAGP